MDEYEKKAEEYECKRMSGLHKHMLCLNEKTIYIYIMKNCFGRIRQTASSCAVICDCSRHHAVYGYMGMTYFSVHALAELKNIRHI